MQMLVVGKLKRKPRGAKDNRLQREELINKAKRLQIDVIIVWKLDRWGRSVNDLFHTLNELNGLGLGLYL